MAKPSEIVFILRSALEGIFADNNKVNERFWREVDLTMESIAIAFAEANCINKTIDALRQIKDNRRIVHAIYYLSHVFMHQQGIEMARKTIGDFIEEYKQRFINDDDFEISRYLIKLWMNMGCTNKALIEVRKIISKSHKEPEFKADKILKVIKKSDENAALREIAKDNVIMRRVSGLAVVAKSFACKGNLDMAKEVTEWVKNQISQIDKFVDQQDCWSKLAYLYAFIGNDDEALKTVVLLEDKVRIITLALIANKLAKGNSTSRAIFFCQDIGRYSSNNKNDLNITLELECSYALEVTGMFWNDLDVQLLKLDIAERTGDDFEVQLVKLDIAEITGKKSKDWNLRLVKSEVETSYLKAKNCRLDADNIRYCVITLVRAVEVLVGINHLEVAREIIEQIKELVEMIYGAQDASPAFAMMAQALAFVGNISDALKNARIAEDLSKNTHFMLYGYEAWVRIQIMKAYALSEDFQNANRIFNEMSEVYRDEATGEIYAAFLRKGKKDIALRFLMDGLKEKFHHGDRLMKLVRLSLKLINELDDGDTMKYLYEEIKAVLLNK